MKMSEEEIVKYVTDFADRTHGSQTRKYTTERYIVHPIRVMEMVRHYDQDLPVLCAALLHDVLEDTPVTQNEMRHELKKVMDAEQAEKTIRLVVQLTDVFIRKDYPKLNRGARKQKEALRLSAVSPSAQSIKYADIIDNTNDHLTEDPDFARIYLREAKQMLDLMGEGNAALRGLAIALVDRSLHALKPATLS
jgi:(p)ppGpp synthase/HD superfamily hydrolase